VGLHRTALRARKSAAMLQAGRSPTAFPIAKCAAEAQVVSPLVIPAAHTFTIVLSCFKTDARPEV